MRKIISLSLLFIFLLCNNSLVAKEKVYEPFDIQKVKIPEWIDPWGREPISYAEFKKNQPPPQPLKVQSLKKVEREKLMKKKKVFSLVLVLVNSNLYDYIQSSIAQYQDDLVADGYSVGVVLWSGGSPHDLRSYLQSRLSEGLVGAVLIGDLPIGWFEISSPEFPCDLYLMDLDGSWNDNDGDGILDDHTEGSGDVAPEIWIGRLDPSRLTWGGQAQLLQNYFRKNHDYRTGALSLPHRGLAFVDDDWDDLGDFGLQYAYDDVTLINDHNQTTAAEYKTQLMQNYEWIHLSAHSSCWTHTFKTDYDPDDPMEGQSVFNYEIHALGPHAFFYNLYACYSTRFVETNCMGNWYIFGDEFGLAVVGSAKSGCMLGALVFYEVLGLGQNIGESFREWWCCWGDVLPRSYIYGLNILGDPTLTIDVSTMREISQHPEESEDDFSSTNWPALKLTTNEFTQANSAVSLDLSGKPWVVWEDGRYVRSTVFSSCFAQEAWSLPVPVQIYEYYDIHPATTTDSLGNIWAIWVTYVNYSFDICASYHDGIDWSAPESVSTGIQFDVEPSVTTDRDGKVWVAWKSWRPDSSQVSAEIMTSYFDGGIWSTPVQVTSDTADNCDPSIVGDQTGKVWIAWASNRDGDWNIYTCYYDGSWSAPIAVTTDQADDLHAKITADATGRIWVVWQSWGDGDANIYGRYNDEGGWSDLFQFTSDPNNDIMPSIYADPKGQVGLTWMSNRSGNWDVFFSFYDGVSWSSPEQVTADPNNDYEPACLFNQSGNPLIIWASDRDGDWNIYFAFHYSCGDVNGGGTLNLSDAICLADFYFGKPCWIYPQASDVNCDGGIDLSDVILIANYYFGKPVELNCCP